MAAVNRLSDRSTLVLADRVYPRPGTPHLHADALLLRGGRVLAVGPADRIAEPGSARLDLRGAVITPGFIDSHVHITEWALARREIDLGATSSPAAAAALIAAQPPPADSAAWLRGRGWNVHLWGDAAPDRTVLDAVTGDRCAAFQSHDMHALWVNTAALAAAGITASTPDPAGGRIARAADGTPTGLLLENAVPLATAAIPRPASDDVLAAVLAAQAELHSLGITGIHSLPGLLVPEPDPLPVLQRIHAAGRLTLRVLQHLRLDCLEHASALGLRSGFGDDHLRIGAVKMFLDGALGSRTAWMRAPYQDGSGCGVRTLAPDDFRDAVTRAARAGLATAVHAIGDAAVALALDVLADSTLRVAALPHRIEHLQCCPPERLADVARAGIVASVQPAHLITDWPIADRHWGPERSRTTYAFGSLLRAGAVLAFGSDAPVEPVDPRRGLYAAVTRQDLDGRPPDGWFALERIDMAAALHAFTVGPALASGVADRQGRLEPGCYADFAAWDRDPFTIPPADLPVMRCLTAAVDGEIVFS